jgi:hypothetical protein
MAIQENSYENLFEDRPTGGLSAMERRDDLANMLAEKKEPDSEVVTALAKQILGQGLTSKWTGAGKGSAEANARDMAKILAGIGITDIKQFGPITREVDAYIGSDDSGNPIYEKQTERTFGNKETGQVVPLTYSGRQTGNFFGGTYDGKGNTGYGVSFAPDGTPIFYTQGASSNTLANLMQDMGPVFQIGLALATGGLSIPQQIAANMAVQVLSGQDMSTAIKNAAVSMAVANIPSTDFMKGGVDYIKKMGLDPTITNTLTNSFQNATLSGARALLTGADVSDAMLAGATAGGVNSAIDIMMSSGDMAELTKGMSATQKRLVRDAAAGVISGKPVDQVLINAAIAAANAEAREQAKYAPLSDEDRDALNPDQRAIYDQGGTKGLKAYQRAQMLEADKAAAEARENELRIAAARDRDAEIAARVAQDAEAARVAEEQRRAREAAELEAALKAAGLAKKDVVNITAKKTCPVGTFLNPITNDCDPVANAPVVQPPVVEPPPSLSLPSMGTVNITTKKDTCQVGEFFNPITQACEPVSKEPPPTEPPAAEPPTVPVPPPSTPLPSMGQVTITGKKETCPVGTVLNPITGECEPYWDEGNGDTNPTDPTAPKTPAPKTPVATPPATKPTAAKPSATKPPTVATPASALPSFTPSGSAVSAETNTPFYAGEMGDFNLFSTLEEILADKSGKKDSTNSNVKTKMATGGHLDDLLAEQFSVDDLLKLLR